MEKKTVFVLTGSYENFRRFHDRVDPKSSRFYNFRFVTTNHTLSKADDFIYTLYDNYRDHPCFDQIMKAIKSRKAATFVTASTFLMEEDENVQESGD